VLSQLSVIVPTRDRPAALSGCLDALAAQTAADRLEVIVVDDGSLRAADIAAVVARHPAVRLLRGRGDGPAAARNAGAAEAQGAVLCFTDDDCLPRPDWAEQLAAEIDGGADAAAGTTLSAGGALADAAEIVAHAPARVPPLDGGLLAFAPSNNLACARTVWEAVPFDESYPDAAAEDREWCARLASAGYALRRAERARVVHRQDLTLRSFLRRQVRYGSGAYRFRRRDGDVAELEPAGFYLALVRDAFRHGVTVGLLVLLAQVATAVGFVGAAAAQRRRTQP
jgi:glycosyltransferase involved in cell wall biosynthesis